MATLTCDFVRVHFSVVFAKRNAGAGPVSSLKLMSFFGRGESEREGFLLYLILVMHFVNHPLTSRFLKNVVEKMDNTVK